MEDGTEQPVAFASRSLSKAEKNYAHLEKEAVAIMFGVRKFHQYLYGCTFTIYSDHKPLKHIFNENRGIPAMVSSRVQHWALALGAYNFRVCYKLGEENANADRLSRLPLPLPANVAEALVPADTILLFETLEAFTVNAKSTNSPTRIKFFLASVIISSRAGKTNPNWICNRTNNEIAS